MVFSKALNLIIISYGSSPYKAISVMMTLLQLACLIRFIFKTSIPESIQECRQSNLPDSPSSSPP